MTIYKNAFGANELVALEIKEDRCYLDVNSPIMSLRISFDVDQQSDTAEQLVMEADRLLAFLKGGTTDILTLTSGKNHNLVIGKTRLSVPKSNITIRAWGMLSNKSNETTVKSAHLFAQIAKTITPFSTGGHYGILDSLCIRRRKDSLEIVGTDGFRIGVVHIKDSGLEVLNDIDVIVPNDVLFVLTRLVKSDEPCSIYLSVKLFRMEVKYNELKIEVAASPVEGKYPNIQPLLSAPPDHEWEVEATAINQYCTLHKTVATNKRTANAQFTFKDEAIEMTTEGESPMDSVIGSVERVHGTGDHQISLSLKFILDAISLIALNGTEKIKIGISTKTNLVWLRADSTNPDVKTMAVIVPMT